MTYTDTGKLNGEKTFATVFVWCKHSFEADHYSRSEMVARWLEKL